MALALLEETTKNLETKIQNLTNGERLYNLVWAIGLPINGVLKLLTGTLGVSLLSSPDMNLTQTQVIGGIIFGAMVADALVMSIREGIDPSERATRCGSIAFRYTKLLNRLEIKKCEYRANLANKAISEAIYYEMSELKDEEAFIALDEPSFVWIGHGGLKNKPIPTVMQAVAEAEIVVDGTMDLIRELVDNPIPAHVAEKLSDKLAKYHQPI